MPLSRIRLFAVSLAALGALLLWDLSGLDLTAARAFGGSAGFPLRDFWFLTGPMHTGAKYAGWVLELALCLAVTWPAGPFARLAPSRRVQLAVTAMLASGLVSLLKFNNHTSCPWDLQEFGGLAHHVSHWYGWFLADGGGGHCFPAGHAATGFAFVGGYFAFRDEAPRIARAWLATALVAGLVLGLCQQLRGAHFMSHTLWTGWICWMACWLTDPLFARSAAAYPAEVAL